MKNLFRKIGHVVFKMPGLKNIKPCILKIIKPIELKFKNKRLLKQGISVLSNFDEILSANNIPYSLIFGTLLGAVREKGFIKHDLDIDVAVLNNVDFFKLNSILIDSGFELIRRAETDNGDFSRELTYMKDGIQIDIFFFYPYEESKEDQYYYTVVYVPFPDYNSLEESIKNAGGAMPIQLILPYAQETERIRFENIFLPAITNRIEFLEARYGKNWKIPDPTFVYPKMGDVKCNYRHDKLTKLIIWK